MQVQLAAGTSSVIRSPFSHQRQRAAGGGLGRAVCSTTVP
jgi:hypothetical protein